MAISRRGRPAIDPVVDDRRPGPRRGGVAPGGARHAASRTADGPPPRRPSTSSGRASGALASARWSRVATLSSPRQKVGRAERRDRREGDVARRLALGHRHLARRPGLRGPGPVRRAARRRGVERPAPALARPGAARRCAGRRWPSGRSAARGRSGGSATSPAGPQHGRRRGPRPRGRRFGPGDAAADRAAGRRRRPTWPSPPTGRAVAVSAGADGTRPVVARRRSGDTLDAERAARPWPPPSASTPDAGPPQVAVSAAGDALSALDRPARPAARRPDRGRPGRRRPGVPRRRRRGEPGAGGRRGGRRPPGGRRLVRRRAASWRPSAAATASSGPAATISGSGVVRRATARPSPATTAATPWRSGRAGRAGRTVVERAVTTGQ